MARRATAQSSGVCAMAVMGKASVAGRAKTRLISPVGADAAACLNTAFLLDAVGNVIAASASASIAPYVAYSPAGSEAFFRGLLPGEVGLIDACQANFGDCLLGTVAALFERGHESACVLNSDSPTLPTRLLVEAAAHLRAPGDRAVLGPSLDGGYYLLGLKCAHRELFDAIEWSTEQVCAQTLRRAAAIGLEVILLDPWYDVDDSAALRRLYGELCPRLPSGAAGGRGGTGAAAGGYAAPNTCAALKRLSVTT